MVTTVDANGNRLDITNTQDMERAILQNNNEKFHQSSHTPFYSSPLKEEFGFKRLTSSAQAVLAGVYESNCDIDSCILDVIAQWQLPEKSKALGPLSMALSVESYVSYWRKAREETACYPSALSFTTMKLGAYDPQIATLDYLMTRIPLVAGFALKRWQHFLDHRSLPRRLQFCILTRP
jgi:hypothetical protein